MKEGFFMLKKRDLNEIPALFDLLSHPDVYPYVRQKAKTSDEYYFITKQLIEAEENGEAISRTVLDEYYQPIGTINLFDIQEHYGFLATWIGQPFFGKGYNKIAKELFFHEVFFELQIEMIFMKIRRTNLRSIHAISKLPYISIGNTAFPEIYNDINKHEDIYDLFFISKEHYEAYEQFIHPDISIITRDDEDVS